METRVEPGIGVPVRAAWVRLVWKLAWEYLVGDQPNVSRMAASWAPVLPSQRGEAQDGDLEVGEHVADGRVGRITHARHRASGPLHGSRGDEVTATALSASSVTIAGMDDMTPGGPYGNVDWRPGLDMDPDPAAYPPSPVPSDARLWPGELPFTAFGQWGEGRMDNRVFEQDVYWVDIHGRPHLVADESDMTPDYINNVIAFLVDGADYFHCCAMLRNAVQAYGDAVLFGEVPGELLAAELGAPLPTQMTALEWLESTPLMRALRRRKAQLANI